MSAWSPILEQLEHQLRRQERALRSGAPVPPTMVFDRPTEPMTPTETIRATDLMMRTDALLEATVTVVRSGRSPGSTPYGL